MAKESRAYRSLFSLGWIFGLLGALVWLQPDSWPVQVHSEIFVGGFLLSCCAGFLLTAIPTMTQAPSPSSLSIAAIGSFLLLGVIASLNKRSDVSYLFYILATLTLIVTLGYCFQRRRFDPPPLFAFVALGLLSGLAGQFLTLLSVLQIINSSWLSLGKSLFFEMMILSLVVGIGARIIPVLLGWKAKVMNPEDRMVRSPVFVFLKRLHWHLVLSAFALLATFLVEFLYSPAWGHATRAILVGSLAFGPWKLFMLPKLLNYHRFFLWLSCWFLIAGLIGRAVSAHYQLHWQHVFFIGCFGLMTVMVAFHVFLEHEGWDRNRKSSPILLGAGLLFVLAIVARLFILIQPAHYILSLRLSAAALAVGLVLWAAALFPIPKRS
jgi:uncharacterized protein involved in response to NO